MTMISNDRTSNDHDMNHKTWMTRVSNTGNQIHGQRPIMHRLPVSNGVA